MPQRKQTKQLRAKKAELTRISRTIRAPIYRGGIRNRSYLLYFEEANLDGASYSMPFVILPTRPCSWLRKSGGCFECGYSNLANKDIEDREILHLFDECVKLLEVIPHQMVAIGTSGSFLDPEELSRDAQWKILKRISALPNIEVIGIESRPEFIASETFEEMCKTVYPKRIMVGMGLESSNDIIREFCINKGLALKDFLTAKNIVKRCPNASALAYILVGKPFLPRVLDMMDAVHSINSAVDAGFDRVVLMATSLRQNTLAKALYEIGEYDPPTPRGVIEVLKRLDPKVRSKVIIANPRLPTPISVNQCSVCSGLLQQLIVMYKYSSNYNYLALADKLKLDCQCIREYETPLKYIEMPPLERVILDSYERVLRKMEARK